METGISNWHIWHVYPMKLRELPLFQIPTQLISRNHYLKLIFRHKNETKISVWKVVIAIRIFEMLTLRK